jgi:hypothetical protein
MLHRLLTTAGVAAVVAFVVGGGAFAVASSSGGSDGPVRTIVVIEKSSNGAFIDLGKKGFSVGDEFIIKSTFWNTARTHRVGSNHGYCVIVGADKAQCTGTARLMGGSLSYSGISADSRVTTIAITGGTGALESAEGQVTVRNLDASGNVSRDVIELTG